MNKNAKKIDVKKIKVRELLKDLSQRDFNDILYNNELLDVD